MADPPFQSGGEPPAIRSADDVKAQFPEEMIQEDADQPVTDAVCEALAGGAKWYQYYADVATAQADELRATEQYLDGLAEDRDAARGTETDDENFRERVITDPVQVSVPAIIAAVNAILARYNAPQTTQVVDSVLDRWFVHASTSPTSTWHSFIGRTPNYPERLYEGDALQNGGSFLAGSDPLGARVFSDAVGRELLILVPDLTLVSGSGMHLWSSTPALSPGEPDPHLSGLGAHVGAGAGPPRIAIVHAISGTAQEIYDAITDQVDRLIGHSVRWVMISEPSLNT